MTNSLPESLQRHRAKPAVERQYTPAEVAAVFGVSAKTVTRWERLGSIQAMRTPGGHRRFTEAEVRRVYEAGGGAWPTP